MQQVRISTGVPQTLGSRPGMVGNRKYGCLLRSRFAAIFSAWLPFHGVSCALLVILLSTLNGYAQTTELVNTTPRLVVQQGHSWPLNQLSFSPDGKFLLSLDDGGSAIAWNIARGSKLAGFRLDPTSSTLKYSPDGTKFAARFNDGGIVLFDLASRRQLFSLASDVPLINFTFSLANNSILSLDRNGRFRQWAVSDGTELSAPTTVNLRKYSLVRLSPNGELIVDWERETIRVIRSRDGKLLFEAGAGDSNYSRVAFSPDGRILAANGRDGKLRLWNTASGREILVTSNGPWSKSDIAFSADGRLLAFGFRDSIKLLDVTTGRVRSTFFAGNGERVDKLAISPQGTIIAAATENSSSIQLWDVAKGERLPLTYAEGARVSSKEISSDSKHLVTGMDDGSVHVFDFANGRKLYTIDRQREIRTTVPAGPLPEWLCGQNCRSEEHVLTSYTQGHKGEVRSIAIAPDNQTFATAGEHSYIKIWDLPTGRHLADLWNWSGKGSKTIRFTADGKRLIATTEGYGASLWDAKSGKRIRDITEAGKYNSGFAFSADGEYLITTGGPYNSTRKSRLVDGAIMPYAHRDLPWYREIFASHDGKTLISSGSNLQHGKTGFSIELSDLETGEWIRTLRDGLGPISNIDIASDGKRLALTGNSRIRILDMQSGKDVCEYKSTGVDYDAIFSADGRRLFSSGDGAQIRILDASTCTLLVSVTQFLDGRWLVSDPDGRFDTTDLEDMPYLHWVLPDDPFDSVPLEVFMRDYYEPNLLQRIMKGEKLKPVRPLTNLNRLQPVVRITTIEGDPMHADRVNVSVTATKSEDSDVKRKNSLVTAAHDLRLFRNGQLIGHADGILTKPGNAPFTKTFSVHLPAGKAPLQFSAYAFNDDGVKSETARGSYQPAADVSVPRPRAYLINVGVNAHDNTAWNLRFAANDARLIGQALAPRLVAQARYEEVVVLPLVSEVDGPRLATKANLKAVLDVLSGRSVHAEGMPSVERLRAARPDDLVLLSFSGHGYGEDGIFHLITSDTGAGNDKAITSELKKRSVSSNELSQWLRDVDAGDIAMIVDACHSAASVGDEFKPGPMGSRNLGQLAFDKGVRLLAASQADEVALESDLIRQGLLSFALVEEGLEGRQADFAPRDNRITLEEWLKYGLTRVPSLAEEVKSGKLLTARGADGRGRIVRLTQEAVAKKAETQQPALFNFSKKGRDVVIQ